MFHKICFSCVGTLLAVGALSACAVEPADVELEEASVDVAEEAATTVTKTVAEVAWEAVPSNYQGASVFFDGAGNVVCTGTQQIDVNAFRSNIATTKYASTGRTLWSAAYQGPQELLNQGLAGARDRAGNIYVAGAIHDEESNYDIAVVKYGPQGEQLWDAVYAGPVGSDESPVAIDVDSAGNVLVTGSTNNATPRWQFVTFKLDAEGNSLWSKLYDAGDDDTPSPFKGATAVDRDGNLYVTGWRVVLKYGADGALAWDKKIRSNTVALDSEDHLWLTSAEGTLQLDGAGNVLTQSPEGGVRIIARDGFVWLTSTDMSRQDNWDYRTSKLDAQGRWLWSVRFDGGYQDMAQDMAVDAAGNAYVTGASVARYGLIGTSSDYLTVKYDTSGKEVWTARRAQSNTAQSIAIDGNGGFVVTGISGHVVRYREVQKVEKQCRAWEFWCRWSK